MKVPAVQCRISNF